MPDIMQRGSSWLAGKLQTQVSQSVTYTHNAQAVGSGLKATPGRSMFEQDNGEGGIIRFESQDFIFTADELTLAGNVIEPENGDRVTWNGNTFEVLGSSGEPSRRYSDGYRNQVRVHTKQVSA